MTHRRTSRLLALALGTGLLLSGATAASAAPVQDRAPVSAEGSRDAGKRDVARKADRALDKLRQSVLADVDKADARVVKASSLAKKGAALSPAHRTALVAAANAVRADLAGLRSDVLAATSTSRLTALRKAVPASAGSHLDAVVRLVARADVAVAASTAADALLVAAFDAAVAEGKDVSGVEEDVATKLRLAAAARLQAAGDADAALAVGRRLAEKKLPAAVKAVNASVGGLQSSTDDVEDLTDEVEDLPAPPAVEPEPEPETPDEPEDETPDDETPEDEAPVEPTV